MLLCFLHLGIMLIFFSALGNHADSPVCCSMSVYSHQGADLPIVVYQQIMTIALSNGMNALVMIAARALHL